MPPTDFTKVFPPGNAWGSRGPRVKWSIIHDPSNWNAEADGWEAVYETSLKRVDELEARGNKFCEDLRSVCGLTKDPKDWRPL